MSPLVNFFLVGCQKSATTWLYRCFREHPDIYVPDEDEIHFFDIHYDRGMDWYHSHYAPHEGEARTGDTTSSYVRARAVPSRLHTYNPEGQIIVSLRNPIDRAFSHYWHEKKKEKIAFDFEEVFSNYDLYESWIATGFYDRHIQRFYEYFPEERVLILIFEDLKRAPKTFIRRVYEFLEVDSTFRPSVLDRKVNQAWHRASGTERCIQRLDDFLRSGGRLLPSSVRQFIKTRKFVGSSPLQIQSEYERGMKPSTRERLRRVFQPHTDWLAGHLNRDLSCWT